MVLIAQESAIPVAVTGGRGKRTQRYLRDLCVISHGQLLRFDIAADGPRKDPHRGNKMTLFYWHIVLNLSLVTLLAMNISRLRIRERVGLGDGGKLALKKAIRPHANALEHVLPFSFMVFVAASLGVGDNYLLILIATFFVSRLVHAASYLYSSDKRAALGFALVH